MLETEHPDDRTLVAAVNKSASAQQGAPKIASMQYQRSDDHSIDPTSAWCYAMTSKTSQTVTVEIPKKGQSGAEKTKLVTDETLARDMRSRTLTR